MSVLAPLILTWGKELRCFVSVGENSQPIREEQHLYMDGCPGNENISYVALAYLSRLGSSQCSCFSHPTTHGTELGYDAEDSL